MNLTQITIEKLRPDPKNPRTDTATSRHSELVASIRVHGIKVPLIAYSTAGGVIVADGHRRLDAAREVGLQEVPIILLSKEPSEADLLATQLTINGHREALNPVDEYEAFKRLAQLNHWTASELAHALAVSPAEVTRVMSIGKLSHAERQLVREGKISKSAAYALSRTPPDQRPEMARKAAAGEVTRDQLNRQVRRSRQSEKRGTMRRVSCVVAGGVVSVQSAAGHNMASVVEVLDGLARELRKLMGQGLDLSTAVRVLKDREKAQRPAASRL